MTCSLQVRTSVQGNYAPPSGDRGAMVAVDLGAESCRVSLLRWINEVPEITVAHRFPNAPTFISNSLRWDIRKIYAGVEKGLRECARIATEGIATIGIDGWAVDYVRLDSQGQLIGNPFCYRDERNAAAQKQVHIRISAERLYELTGAQSLPLNTLYQLFADNASEIEQSARWVNLPEYVLHRLGGKLVSEYTNATHTELLSVSDQSWCPEIFSAAGLDLNAAPLLARTGTEIGRVKGPLAELPAFRNTRLIVPACHDTASAIAGIPAHGNDWAFISSGTWSLVGCVLDVPNVSATARNKNFSNEGGVGGKTYFLKNVNGMWLLRQCMEQWQSQGATWTLDDLISASAKLPSPDHLLDIDDPDLLLPGNMLSRINAQQLRKGKAAISEQSADAPVAANLIFHSLAARYAAVLQDAMKITGKVFTRLYIVGGGSRNAFLNRLTAKATGIKVVVGPTECATIGNFAIQLAALAGAYNDSTGADETVVAKFAELLAPIASAAQQMPPVSSERQESTPSSPPGREQAHPA